MGRFFHTIALDGVYVRGEDGELRFHPRNEPRSGHLTGLAGGENVHAKVSVDGRDRERVESLCRYLARPPIAQDRLTLEPNGMVRYDFKSAWKDGTRAVRLHPLDFLARLAALVPPPRFHMVQWVLSPVDRTFEAGEQRYATQLRARAGTR